MPANVVCISRTLGAEGEAVGRLVAQALGFRYVDEEIIELAAERAGTPRDVVASAEERRALVSRLLENLAWAGTAVVVPTVMPTEYSGENEAAVIRDVVREVGERGEAVIVAHAASLALPDRDGALRVFVTAPLAVRGRRLAAEAGVDDAQGEKLARESDRARAAYLKRFYGVSEELPTHYDLVVSTERLAAEEAAGVIVRATGASAAVG
jgi:hypothetical protein